VSSSEADVVRAAALEKARPCKAFVQLLGPIPRGLRLLPPRAALAPLSADETAKRQAADAAALALRRASVASAEAAGLPPPEPEPEPEPEDDGTLAAAEAEEAVSKRAVGSELVFMRRCVSF
jgi:hypothetical protein